MEDRHTISEPRIHHSNNKNHELTWEVDIYRHGVLQPIDTILISNTVLPPRKNKKGKILWKLPTEEGILPSFGTDEKLRILELFKEQKKAKKKIKAAESKVTVQSNHNEESNRAWNADELQHSFSSQRDNPFDTTSWINASLASFHVQEDTSSADTGTGTGTSYSNQFHDTNIPNTHISPPPGLSYPTTFIMEHTALTHPPQYQHQHQFITIPPTYISPYPHKANVLAKALIDLYYPHIHAGLTDTLASYYTNQAQQSVNVGAAYNLVIGQRDIAHQLASLSNMTFIVRGVVAQDLLDQQGIHVLVTGFSIKKPTTTTTTCSTNHDVHTSSTITYFAHSLNLTCAQIDVSSITPQSGDITTSSASSSQFSFQIQNDAMSFIIHEP